MTSSDVIAARVKRFRETGDPAALWPELTDTAYRASQREIVRAAGAVLAGADRVALALPPGVTASSFGVVAFSAGMGPLLGVWCETGRVDAPDALAQTLAAHLDHGRRRARRMCADLGEVLAALGERGVETALLKGTHTAYTYFPDPGSRPMADVDILVAPSDLPAARGVLAAQGFVEHNTEALPHRSDWSRPGAGGMRSLDLLHADTPWTLELHATLDREYSPGVVARFGAVGLAHAPVRHDFGASARVLPEPLLLAYLACHASSHLAALQPLRLTELVLVARRDFQTAEAWAGLARLLHDRGVGKFAFPALALADRLVGGTIPTALLDGLAASAPSTVRRWVARATPATTQRLRPTRHDYAPMWAASPGERLAYAAHLFWPRTPAGGVSFAAVLARQWGRLRRLVRRVLGRTG